MGVQGYSGKAAATARAPASFVHWDIPTKNSLPENSCYRLAFCIKNKFYCEFTSSLHLINCYKSKYLEA